MNGFSFSLSNLFYWSVGLFLYYPNNCSFIVSFEIGIFHLSAHTVKAGTWLKWKGLSRWAEDIYGEVGLWESQKIRIQVAQSLIFALPWSCITLCKSLVMFGPLFYSVE